MKNGRCPKCDVSRVNTGFDDFPKSGPFTCNAIPFRLTALAPLDRGDRVDGGYGASGISTAEELDTIRRQWPRASGAASNTATTVDD